MDFNDNGVMVKVIGRPVLVVGDGVPEIKKVIVNNPATIIIWDDDVKTVVKCGANDTFDVEKGIAMAYIKRVMFDNKTTQMNKWFQQYEEELTVGAVHE